MNAFCVRAFEIIQANLDFSSAFRLEYEPKEFSLEYESQNDTDTDTKR